MSWFKREPDRPQAQPAATSFSIDQVRELADKIGPFRLRIVDPKLKVPISQIAQNAEAYLMRGNPSGQPSQSEIMRLVEDLRMTFGVLEQYVAIQDNPAQPNRQAEMQKGYDAIISISRVVLSSNMQGGSQAMTGYGVDTDILAARQYGTR